ncbi:hypothetical protein [Hymenobacter latericus]|uniref:hypothetical protein n=1 Tax=Hymenobacter sp. YIM 151858-1 TaxID=2987688 RepID=UPI002225C49F|nr:hypothetical protein [Hymenobacter sp. YIM 151858-1]UYZ60969.1 hypothetical protein OIS50_09225 [Hymenobacter sp. YIM 151858-1]
MILRYAWVCLFGLPALVACRKDTFEPDPANKQLPLYTEKGNNAGGALINGQVWRAYMNQGLLGRRKPLVIEAQEDTLFINFDGEMQNSSAADPREGFVFALRRDGRVPFTLDSLLNLNNRRFVLDGRRHFARMDWLGNYTDYGSGRGELHVRRVQKKVSSNTTVGGQPYTEYILSGTFRFTAYRRSDSVQVVDGRFDHRINRLGYY